METYTIMVGDIPVVITRKRVKNVNLRIGPNGQAQMSVPLHMSRERAEQVAREHASWFGRNVQRWQDARSGQPCTWETGDIVQVWGVPTRLEVVEEPGRPMCRLADDRLMLHVPQGSTVHDRCDAVERWLAGELSARVVELLPKCEGLVGSHATNITIRRMKTRWGSCTSRTGRIRLNMALAECPPECTRMVLLHELCHLREANHGPRFHALMDLVCPDWRASQRWLDEHPPRV